METLKPRESRLVHDVLARFGSRPDLMLWRNNVGASRTPAGRVIRFGTPGAADILGAWRRVLTVHTVVNPYGFMPHEKIGPLIVGQAIAIECKRAGEKQSEKQRRWQAAFEAAGGLYILAYHVDDVRDVLA